MSSMSSMSSPGKLALVLVLLLAACGPSHGTRSASADGSADGTEALADTVVDLTEDMFEAWGELEPEPYLARFADDLVFYIEGARYERAGFGDLVRQAMADLREHGWRAEITSGPRARPLGPDAAVSSLLYRVYEGDRGASVDTLEWGWTVIWERRDGSWTIVESHESMAPVGSPGVWTAPA